MFLINYVVREDVFAGSSPFFDKNGAFAEPTFRTQMFGQVLSQVKELSSAYIAATTSNDPSGSFYSKGTGIKATLYWYTSKAGDFADSSAQTHANAVWTSANTDGLFSFPRVSYRAVALEIRLSPTTGTKPPAGMSITAFEFEQPEPDQAHKPTR